MFIKVIIFRMSFFILGVLPGLFAGGGGGKSCARMLYDATYIHVPFEWRLCIIIRRRKNIITGGAKI